MTLSRMNSQRVLPLNCHTQLRPRSPYLRFCLTQPSSRLEFVACTQSRVEVGLPPQPIPFTLIHLKREEFERITEGLADALDFSRTIGAADGSLYERGGSKGVLGEVDFYTRFVTDYSPLYGNTENCGEATKV